jgi:hypothetical protein
MSGTISAPDLDQLAVVIATNMQHKGDLACSKSLENSDKSLMIKILQH